MKKKHNIIDIAAKKLHETEQGLLLDDGSVQTWVPKSLVQDNDDDTFSMPEWLAKEKRFI